jgi:hypothetical protein
MLVPAWANIEQAINQKLQQKMKKKKNTKTKINNLTKYQNNK